MFPAANEASGIVPTGRGVRFPCTTLTRKLWVAERPPGSVAVTVMVAVPTPSPVMVRVLPDRLTVTLAVLEDVALCVRWSPSGSLKYGETSSEKDLFRSTARFPTVPTASGVRLGIVTWKRRLADRPAESRAVTVTVAFPRHGDHAARHRHRRSGRVRRGCGEPKRVPVGIRDFDHHHAVHLHFTVRDPAHPAGRAVRDRHGEALLRPQPMRILRRDRHRRAPNRHSRHRQRATRYGDCCRRRTGRGCGVFQFLSVQLGEVGRDIHRHGVAHVDVPVRDRAVWLGGPVRDRRRRERRLVLGPRDPVTGEETGEGQEQEKTEDD